MGKYHDALNVSVGATDEEIKAAHRKLVKELHPDNPTTGNEEQFKKIQEAYEGLKEGRTGPESPKPNMSYGNPFADMQEAATHFRNAQQFVNIQQEINVPVNMLFSGGTIEVPLAIPVQRGNFFVQHMSTRKITIPKNCEYGHKIELSGETEGSRILLFVRPVSTSDYHVDGINLVQSISIPLEQIVLGEKSSVKLPDGKTVQIAFDVNAINDGKPFRLKGKGLRHIRGIKGDLYLEVRPILPNFNDEEKDKFRNFTKSLK